MLTPDPRRHYAALGILACLAIMLVVSLHRSSPTIDEPQHLIRGLAYWWSGDTRLSFAHPPLANALSALPAAVMEPPWDFESKPAWRRAEVRRLAREYFDEDYPRARRQLIAARWMTVLLTLLLAVYLYVRALQLFDWTTAITALACLCLNPVIIAHGHLITTDMPVTLAMTLAIGEGARYLEQRGVLSLVTFSLASAAAFATKYNASILIILFLIAAAFWVWRRQGRLAGTSRGRALLQIAVAFGVVTATCVVAVNASYRFQRTGMSVREILREPEPRNGITTRYHNRMLEETSPLPRLPESLRIPLPYSYIIGGASIRVHARIRGHHSYFMGQTRSDGWPAYFPTLLLIKTPLILLLLLGVGVALAISRRTRPSPVTSLLLLFIGLYLTIAMTSRLNLGIRHILPVFPILALLAGRGAAMLFEAAIGSRWHYAGGITIALLGGALWAMPDPISDFNALIGGRDLGTRVSIIGEDWGQDVGRFSDALTDQGISKLWYDEYGYGSYELGLQHEVEIAGCDVELAPGQWFAMHAGKKLRMKGRCAAWLERAPDQVFNHHIFLYRAP